jgi:sec-independent protein translocase protein TatA
MPGFIGVPELLLLGLVALLLFGPKRLPEMGRGLGKGMREFKDSVTGITDVSAAPVAVEGTQSNRSHEEGLGCSLQAGQAVGEVTARRSAL